MVRLTFAVAWCMLVVGLGENSHDSMLKRNAMQVARDWLRTHQDPGDEAGMAELKATNPDAYAVVNALLTKKSLGLLNSRHPTASMNPTDASDSAVDTPQIEPKVEPKLEITSPEVDVQVPSPPRQHDFLHWKPASDDQMVSNVLGMVAGLTKGRSAPQVPEEVANPSVNMPEVKLPEAEPQPQILPAKSQPVVQVQSQPQEELKPQHHASGLALDWGNTYAGVQPKSGDTQATVASQVTKMPVQQTAPFQQADEDEVTPKHHDFLSWKPSNEEQVVSNVLGMVAGLTHHSPPQAPPAVSPDTDIPASFKADETETQSTMQSMPQQIEQPVSRVPSQTGNQPQHHASVLSFDWGNTYAGIEPKKTSAQIALASPVKKAPAQQDLSNNPYLKGIDFSSELNPATMSQVSENTYLKSVDFDSVPPPKSQPGTITAKDIGNPNKLTKFNWYN